MVFYRKTEKFIYLSDLKGKKIAIGEDKSGTEPVAVQLLKDNNINKHNTKLLHLTSEEAVKELVDGKIDGAFFIMSFNSKLIKELLLNQNIELMDFRRNVAYISRYPYLTTLELGEGMINLEYNIPSKPKILLGTTATLVGRANLDSHLIYMMLKTITIVHSMGGLFEQSKQFPSQKFVDLPGLKVLYLRYAPWLQKLIQSPRTLCRKIKNVNMPWYFSQEVAEDICDEVFEDFFRKIVNYQKYIDGWKPLKADSINPIQSQLWFIASYKAVNLVILYTFII
jgi:hypothetical protein